MKKIVGKIHLVLGLLTGVVVVIMSLAAAVFVWEEELMYLSYPGLTKVAYSPGAKPLPIDSLRNIASRAMSQKAQTLVFDHDPEHAWRAVASKRLPDSLVHGISHWSDTQYKLRAWLNPYTGEVLGVQDLQNEWLTLTKVLHQQLWLTHDLGHYVVGYSVLGFFVLVVTGLVLWWPRSKAAAKHKFTIPLGRSGKRVNYDLHSIGGFYAQFGLLILMLSGLTWSFDWWDDALVNALGKAKPKDHEAAILAVMPDAVSFAQDRYAGFHKVRLGWKKDKKTDEPILEVQVKYRGKSSVWEDTDHYILDPETKAVQKSTLMADRGTGQKWQVSKYAIHTASIGGKFTKVLGTLLALFSATLPITGFLIWWGRGRKTGRI